MAYVATSSAGTIRAGAWLRAAFVAASITTASMVTVGHVAALIPIPAVVTKHDLGAAARVGQSLNDHVIEVSAPVPRPAALVTGRARGRVQTRGMV